MRMLMLVLVVFSVSACASTMDELFAEAHQSSDWSAVNRRLDKEAEREQQRLCSPDQVLYCEISMGETICTCIRNATLWDRTREIAHRKGANRH